MSFDLQSSSATKIKSEVVGVSFGVQYIWPMSRQTDMTFGSKCSRIISEIVWKPSHWHCFDFINIVILLEKVIVTLVQLDNIFGTSASLTKSWIFDCTDMYLSSSTSSFINLTIVVYFISHLSISFTLSPPHTILYIVSLFTSVYVCHFQPTLGPPAFRPNQTRHPLIRNVTVVVEQNEQFVSKPCDQYGIVFSGRSLDAWLKGQCYPWSIVTLIVLLWSPFHWNYQCWCINWQCMTVISNVSWLPTSAVHVYTRYMNT